MAIRNLADCVVVITGASSGIGRATALAFARRGSTVILAARSEESLQEAAQECEQAGGKAFCIPTDVTDEQQVFSLARETINRFGKIDVWVNNAAVTLFSRFEETPSDAFRQVIETNLFGYVYGARAVLPQFRSQQQGVLINVASVTASAPQPYTSAYSISKNGIRALSESLRQELYLDGLKNVDVCTILPATFDTPLFQHAANFTGREVKALPPVYPPEMVAEAIIKTVQNPKREVFVGGAGQRLDLQHRLAPEMSEKMMAKKVDKQHLGDRPAFATHGNLFSSMPQYDSLTGGWGGKSRTALRTAATIGALGIPLLLGLVVIGARLAFVGKL